MVSNTTTAKPVNDEPQRIVVLGAAVAETAMALGASARIVGVDSTSAGIIQGREVPDLGFYRRLSAVGILSVAPDLVLATHDSGPPPIFTQLEQARVRVVRLPQVASPASAVEQIEHIATAIGRVSEGQKLIERIEHQLKILHEKRTSLAEKPRMLFIYARGPGALLVGGSKTSADAMIALVGGTNVAGAFEGFKPLSPEALLANPPQVLLMTQHGLDAMGGTNGLRQHAILSKTPAVREERIHAQPARELLSFGPDFAARALALLNKISKSSDG
ncbi:MAG: ABC transporter substrate-binding protein [Myxococcota bacterium]